MKKSEAVVGARASAVINGERQFGVIRTVGDDGGVTLELRPGYGVLTDARRLRTELKKGARVVGPARQESTAHIAQRYNAGQTIRAIARDTGRSYGYVHRILSESGTTLRPVGGTPKK